jgi:hypothetical protein
VSGVLPPAAANQFQGRMSGADLQVAMVLAAPQGGVTLRVVDPHTGMMVAPQLTRDEAEALLAALRVTLEATAPDPHAEKVASFNRWRAERPTLPRSESISNTFARRAGDLPEDTYADRLALALGLQEERSCGSQAFG